MKFSFLKNFIFATLILSSLLSSCQTENVSFEENSTDNESSFVSNESYSISENISDISEILEDISSSEADVSEIIYESSESIDNSEVFSSFESAASQYDSSFESDDLSEDVSDELSEDASDYEYLCFNEPEGNIVTTPNGNVFETNCTDSDALSIMCKIADTASKYNKATVYYTDVEQKYYFAYGYENIHNTASTIKAPYAAYILKSGADLSEILVMEQRHVFTGSGVLKNKEVGSKFSVSELIRYMITRSDNTAYAMLLERFGTNGFREYSQSLGIDFKLPSGGYTTCDIREMATFLLDIYYYEGTSRGKDLIKQMKNCSYSLQIPKAVPHSVAHKFGFIYEGKAFHDMGIVYAPTPYLELIFTKIDGTVYDTKAFLEIGKLVESLNQELSDKY